MNIIKLPDREVLIERLKHEVGKIMKDFDEVEEVILFGSIARGDYGTYSDADLLIILSSSPYKRYFDRIPKYASRFVKFDVPVEVFPYTTGEITRMKENGNLFVKNMLDEGISLSKR